MSLRWIISAVLLGSLVGLPQPASTQCLDGCCYYFTIIPSNLRHACNHFRRTLSLTLFCEVLAPNNTVHQVRWYTSELQSHASVSGELVSGQVSENKSVVSVGPYRGLERIRSRLRIERFTPRQNGFYWCEIEAGYVCLQPSPSGHVELSHTYATQNCNKSNSSPTQPICATCPRPRPPVVELAIKVALAYLAVVMSVVWNRIKFYFYAAAAVVLLSFCLLLPICIACARKKPKIWGRRRRRNREEREVTSSGNTTQSGAIHESNIELKQVNTSVQGSQVPGSPSSPCTRANASMERPVRTSPSNGIKAASSATVSTSTATSDADKKAQATFSNQPVAGMGTPSQNKEAPSSLCNRPACSDNKGAGLVKTETPLNSLDPPASSFEMELATFSQAPSPILINEPPDYDSIEKKGLDTPSQASLPIHNWSMTTVSSSLHLDDEPPNYDCYSGDNFEKHDLGAQSQGESYASNYGIGKSNMNSHSGTVETPSLLPHDFEPLDFSDVSYKKKELDTSGQEDNTSLNNFEPPDYYYGNKKT